MPDVTVVGSLNMDLVVRTPRLPHPGETISGYDFQTIAGGKGANQAVAAARQGSAVAMVGCVGDDSFGQHLLHTLRDSGVNTEYVTESPQTSTGVAFVIVDDLSENSIIIIPGANGRLSPHDIEAASALIRQSKVLLLQLEVPLEVVLYAAQLAHENGVTVILNPAPAYPLPAELYEYVDYLIPNESEMLLLAQTQCCDPEEAAHELRTRGAKNVIITLGEKGALLVDEEFVSHISGFPVAPVDTTGAGDAFIGTFAASLAEGETPIKAIGRANAAGALATATIGAQPSLPTRSAITKFLDTFGRG